MLGAFAGPTVVGIPVEFILFAIVLLGVALFHHYTFPIAAGGALVIALYKIFFSPFKTGAGWSGFGYASGSRMGDSGQSTSVAAGIRVARQAL